MGVAEDYKEARRLYMYTAETKGGCEEERRSDAQRFQVESVRMKTMRRPNSQTTISDKTFESKDPTFHEG